MIELTKQQTERQDFVDNAIFNLINELVPSDKEMKWNIEAIGLGLLAKNDTSVYLTPEGFKFVIQMQLHKSLKLMNYLNIN